MDQEQQICTTLRDWANDFQKYIKTTQLNHQKVNSDIQTIGDIIINMQEEIAELSDEVAHLKEVVYKISKPT